MNKTCEGSKMKIVTNKQMVEYMQTLHVLPPHGTKKPKRGYILDCVCAFDIETSVIYPEPDNPQAIMYIWQFACNDRVTYGRYWPEYMNMLEEIRKVIPVDTRIICYVHNLSYEFQFLSGIFRFFKDNIYIKLSVTFIQSAQSLKDITYKIQSSSRYF